MAALQEYKCPCCGGAINFDSGLQKMKCPFCDTTFEVDALRGYDEDLKNDAPDQMEWDTTAGSEWEQGETDGMSVYTCKSCGGEIVGDQTMAATTCPYCDNQVVVMGKLSGMLKPDSIIPFKLDKKAAKEGLIQHLKGKPLLPRVFKSENHIDEVKGLYVPFWLFDSDVDADIRYKATRTRFWSDGDYDYTETSHYSVLRGGTLGFHDVPVDGSTKMDDDLMESIEPFDLSGTVDFQTAYLAGYLADKYDVTAEDSIERANERIKKSTEQTFAQTADSYDSVVAEASSIRFQNGKARYALYPVWILNTSWRDQKYTFAMNGQTGKFVGDLPTDWGAFFRWLFGLLFGVAAIVFGIQYLLWLL